VLFTSLVNAMSLLRRILGCQERWRIQALDQSSHYVNRGLGSNGHIMRMVPLLFHNLNLFEQELFSNLHQAIVLHMM
jgi:hypothetical protein